MSGQWILFLYCFALAVIIFLQYRALKTRSRKCWNSLFAIEAASVAAALIFLFYFNAKEGSGFFPGLQYLGEVIFSLIAAPTFTLTLIISAILKLIRK